VTAESAGPILDAGMVGSPDQLASARLSLSGADSGHPQRALDLRVYGGLDLRLLPDRGLDMAEAWFAGLPLAWISRVGEVGPLATPRGTDWNRAFGGGLLTTCGLQNVGAPSEGHPQHGTFSHLPARDVRVDRVREGDEIALVVSGVVEDADALGTHLRCERTVRTTTGGGQVVLRDVVTNLGSKPVAAPVLYHVNIGAPLWAPGARLVISSAEVRPRDGAAAAALSEWDVAPEPRPGAVERVFEHVVEPGADGWSSARVVNDALGTELEVAWDAGTLPRLHQWVHPARGVYVLGVEPANCSVLGRAADRAEGRLPMMAAGASRTTRLRIGVRRLPSVTVA
jgi:hypothetical protein